MPNNSRTSLRSIDFVTVPHMSWIAVSNQAFFANLWTLMEYSLSWAAAHKSSYYLCQICIAVKLHFKCCVQVTCMSLILVWQSGSRLVNGQVLSVGHCSILVCWGFLCIHCTLLYPCCNLADHGHRSFLSMMMATVIMAVMTTIVMMMTV